MYNIIFRALVRKITFPRFFFINFIHCAYLPGTQFDCILDVVFETFGL